MALEYVLLFDAPLCSFFAAVEAARVALVRQSRRYGGPKACTSVHMARSNFDPELKMARSNFPTRHYAAEMLVFIGVPKRVHGAE